VPVERPANFTPPSTANRLDGRASVGIDGSGVSQKQPEDRRRAFLPGFPSASSAKRALQAPGNPDAA